MYSQCRLFLLTLAMMAFLVCGCVSTTVKTSDGLVISRVAVGYKAQFKSLKYDPATKQFDFQGYDGAVQFDDFVKAWGAIK